MCVCAECLGGERVSIQHQRCLRPIDWRPIDEKQNRWIRFWHWWRCDEMGGTGSINERWNVFPTIFVNIELIIIANAINGVARVHTQQWYMIFLLTERDSFFLPSDIRYSCGWYAVEDITTRGWYLTLGMPEQKVQKARSLQANERTKEGSHESTTAMEPVLIDLWFFWMDELHPGISEKRERGIKIEIDKVKCAAKWFLFACMKFNQYDSVWMKNPCIRFNFQFHFSSFVLLVYYEEFFFPLWPYSLFISFVCIERTSQIYLQIRSARAPNTNWWLLKSH